MAENNKNNSAIILGQHRRLKIIELLQEEGSARVSYLSKIFDVSEPTVRQDLEKLENEGLIIREHGGAYLRTIPQQVKALSLQHQENLEKKVLIGKKAASLIKNDESIILDSGTTTTEIARNLSDKLNLKIITNSLNIALLLGSVYSFEIMMTGGEFKAPTLSLTGGKAAKFFENIHVDKLFIATGGISFDIGLTYPGFSDLVVKKAMIDTAQEVYLIADSTKIGKIAFASLGCLERIHYFITDNGIKEEDLKKFEAKGIKVILASEE